MDLLGIEENEFAATFNIILKRDFLSFPYSLCIGICPIPLPHPFPLKMTLKEKEGKENCGKMDLLGIEKNWLGRNGRKGNCYFVEHISETPFIAFLYPPSSFTPSFLATCEREKKVERYWKNGNRKLRDLLLR